MIDDLANTLTNMHYELVGKRGAIQVCKWTRESLLDRGVCYKEQFYGIKSHRCVQMSPCVDLCDQRCVFCWRPHELMDKTAKGFDKPAELIDNCIAAYRKKITGFGGNEKANKKKFAEAQVPFSFAISLSGEPTLYPHLAELIIELRRRGIISFLVTNGQHPEVLAKLAKKNALPDQLYVSVDAPDEALYKRINQPARKDGWARLNKTLRLLPKLSCKKVLRITIIRGMNTSNIPEWARLIRPAERSKAARGRVSKGGTAPYIEVKAYMHLGYSRKRMAYSDMPLHSEVLEFASKLAKELGYKVKDQNLRSRVVLLAAHN